VQAREIHQLFNILKKCRDNDIIPNFIKINKNFNLEKAARVLKNSERIILKVFIADTRRTMFNLRSKVVKFQAAVFQGLDHEIFQKIKIFISDRVKCVDNKQRAIYEKKWEHLVCASNTMRMQVESKDKLVVNISSTHLSDTQVNVLSKGLNFAVVPERVPIFDIIKSVESA
jgi:hypothetical protein